MPETKEEMVERRSRNADAAFLGFLRAWDLLEWFWILAGVVVLLVLLATWLLG